MRVVWGVFAFICVFGILDAIHPKLAVTVLFIFLALAIWSALLRAAERQVRRTSKE